MADDKTVVVDSGGGSGGAIAVIVGIIAILAILYVIFGTNLLNKAPDKIDADVKIEQPK
jgi:hypothetical protein